MKRYTKQTKKELKTIAEVCRRWQPLYLTEVAKLFIHIKAQEYEIETLERHLSELRQANFFKKAEELKNAPALPRQIKSDNVKYPLPVRLRLMDRSSEEWRLTLKWNRISESEALSMIEELEKKSVDTSL